MELTAYLFALIGMGSMIALPGIGSAIALSRTGSSVIGSLHKKPETFGNLLVLAALPASQGLYGFVGFILYSPMVTPEISMFKAVITFIAGIMMGVVCYMSAMQQSRICVGGITAIGNGHQLFANTLILAAFPEFYAILSLVATILASNF
ncbi:MAG: ATPase [Bacteroidia bacterium]